MFGAQYQRVEQIALSVMALAKSILKRVSRVVATVGCVILLMNRKNDDERYKRVFYIFPIEKDTTYHIHD